MSLLFSLTPRALNPRAQVLKKVEDWIADLEGKYDRQRRDMEPGSAVFYEDDSVVVKDNVRRFLSDVPFPSWDGKEEIIVKEVERVPTPAHYHDYAPDLLKVDDEPEDEDQDDRDAGERLVRAYSSSCLKQAKSPIPQAIDALKRRRAEKLPIANCSMADGGMIALGPYLGQILGLTDLDLSTNMIFDEGATALSKALKTCLTLTTLHLDHNKIGTYGSTALAEQFKSKKNNLTFLSVRHNQLRCVRPDSMLVCGTCTCV